MFPRYSVLRQQHSEVCRLAVGLHGNMPLMGFDNGFDDRQADTAALALALAGLVDAIETVE